MALFLNIVCPEKTLFQGEVTAVSVPGKKGVFEILQRHAPIISSLQQGCIRYTIQEQQQEIFIHGGFVSVLDNKITICVTI